MGNIDCLSMLNEFLLSIYFFFLMVSGKLLHSIMQHTPRMQMNLLMQRRPVSIPTTLRRNVPNGLKGTIEPDSCMSAIEMFLQGDCLTFITQVVKHLKYSVKHGIKWFIPKSWIIQSLYKNTTPWKYRSTNRNTQPAVACSKSTMETPEQCVKSVQS